MGEVTVFDSERVAVIEGRRILSTELTDGNLFLVLQNGSKIDCGPANANALLDVQGDWDVGTAYSINSIVNHSGSSWIANAATSAGQEPGIHASWNAFIVDIDGKINTSGDTSTGNVDIDVPKLSDVGGESGITVKANTTVAGTLKLRSTIYGPYLQIHNDRDSAFETQLLGASELSFGDGVGVRSWALQRDVDGQIKLTQGSHIRVQQDPSHDNDYVRKAYVDAKGGVRAINVVTDLGADPTGVVPCREVINEAIVDLYNTGGGTVYFPPGTYLIDPQNLNGIELLDNIRLLGDGYNSILKSQDGVLCRTISVGTENKVVNNVEIGYLKVDGGEDAVTSGDHGIYCGGGDNWHIHNVWVHRSGGYGIGLMAQNAALTNLTIQDVLITDAWADGIDSKNNTNANQHWIIDNVHVKDFGRGREGKAGIDIRAESVKITNCLVEYSLDPIGNEFATGIRFRGSGTDVIGVGHGRGGEHSIIANCVVDMGGDYDHAHICYSNSPNAEPEIYPEQKGLMMQNCIAKNAARGYVIHAPFSLVKDCGAYYCDTGIYISGTAVGTNVNGFTSRSTVTTGVEVVTEGCLLHSIFVSGNSSNGWTPRLIRWMPDSTQNVLGTWHGHDLHATPIQDYTAGDQTELTIP